MKKGLLTLILMTVLSTAVAAQQFPQKFVRLVVPFPAGASYDAIARLVAQELSERWGKQVVVENRSGGNGEVGASFVAGSAPDGYTLLFWNNQALINHWLKKDRTFDALNSFTPVSLVAGTPQILVARSDLRVTTLTDLIALGKDGRSDLRYASGGVGTPAHLAAELLFAETGAKIQHIPYRGGGQALTDLLGGQIDILSTGLPAVLPSVQMGRLIGFAVSSQKRSPVLPNVPAMSEFVPGLYVDNVYGVVGPAGLPDEIVAKLHADIGAVMRSPELVAKLTRQGYEVIVSGPVEMRMLMKRDLLRYQKILSAAGLIGQ